MESPEKNPHAYGQLIYNTEGKNGGNTVFKKGCWGDFPGSAVVKNLPASAGDTASSPGPGRSHMPWSNKAHAPQLLSPCATTTEACVPRACAPQEKSLQ